MEGATCIRIGLATASRFSVSYTRMTFAFKTYGCRLNKAEGAQLEHALLQAGFERVPLSAMPQIVVVYSCTVTQKAESECVKFLRQLRAQDPQVFLVLAGCAAETIDGPLYPGLLNVQIKRADHERFTACVCEALTHAGFPVPCQDDHATSMASSLRTQRATLKVQDGCNYFCSYCIVPHVRGAPRSKALVACLDEAKRMIDAGFQEIVITGCNTACYSADGHQLPDLLEKLLALSGLGRIRLGSIEPGTVERAIIDLMVENARIARFLHLPVQHCDNDVLARMRRRYTCEAITAMLDYGLQRIPELGLGVDLIAGFPGENESAHQKNLDFVRHYTIAKLHVFPYSERPGTPAATFTDSVPLPIRRLRAKALIEQGNARMLTYRARYIGRTVSVLIEKVDSEGLAFGWSSEYLACQVSGCSARNRRQLVTAQVSGIDAQNRLICQYHEP